MQMLLLVGAVVASLGAALGTSAVVLDLVFRLMARMR